MKVKKKISFFVAFMLLTALLATGMSSQAASKIKLNKTKLSLGVGESTTLKLANAKGDITWRSSNVKVAAVSKKGKVTAKKAGTAKITARYNNKKYTCKVTVKVIKLNKTKLSLTVGKNYTLKLANATKKVKWTSSNKNVARVSSKGVVTAKKKGKAKIIATSNKKKYICAVNVKNIVYNTNPMISDDSIRLKVGKSYKLSIGGNISDIVWSSANKKIATVKNGEVTGVSAGNTIIYAKVDGKTLKCKVKVSDIVREFKILTDRNFDYYFDYEDMASDNTLYLSTDSSEYITLTNLEKAGEWSIANEDIATLSKSTTFFRNDDNVLTIRSGDTEGTTFVNVKYEGKVYTLKVVVEKFKLEKNEYTLELGKPIDITFPKAIDDVALMNAAQEEDVKNDISITQISDHTFRFKLLRNYEGYNELTLWARGYWVGFNFYIFAKDGLKPSIDKNDVKLDVGDSVIFNVTGTVVGYGKKYTTGDGYLESLGNGQYKFTASNAGDVEIYFEFKNARNYLMFKADISENEDAVLPDYGYDFSYDDKTKMTLEGGKSDWVTIYTNHLVREMEFEVSPANYVGIEYFDGYDVTNGHGLRLGITGQYKGNATVNVKYKGKVVTTINVSVTSDSEDYKKWVEFRDKVHDAVWTEGMTDVEYLDAVCNYFETNYTYRQLDCWGGAAYMIKFGKDLGYQTSIDNSTPSNPSHRTAVIIIDGKAYWYDCQGRKGD